MQFAHNQQQHHGQQQSQQQFNSAPPSQQIQAQKTGESNGYARSVTPGPVFNALNEAQIALLKNQIMAFKLLNKNLPIRMLWLSISH